MIVDIEFILDEHEYLVACGEEHRSFEEYIKQEYMKVYDTRDDSEGWVQV